MNVKDGFVIILSKNQSKDAEEGKTKFSCHSQHKDVLK